MRTLEIYESEIDMISYFSDAFAITVSINVWCIAEFISCFNGSCPLTKSLICSIAATLGTAFVWYKKRNFIQKLKRDAIKNVS